MKKVSVICLLTALAISLSAVLSACSQKTEVKETTKAETQTVYSTTQRVTSTTAPVSKSTENGERLKKAVLSALGENDFEITGDIDYGSFEYRLKDADEAELYSYEQSDEMQKKAEDNASKLVEKIKTLYPDEISLESSQAHPVGSGDNGIDSVIYIITYTNSQNQELTVRAGSNGEIYYAYCNFTW
ncbi:MAG: hypothetical protein ACI4RR_07770 [Eubacterium sp.]